MFIWVNFINFLVNSCHNCGYDLVRFRHKTHFLRVRKKLCVGLKYTAVDFP